MFLLPIHCLDAKNKDVSELGLYRLISADGEQSAEAVGLGTSCSQLIIPPEVSSEGHLPRETSSTLSLTYLVPVQRGHDQGCRNSVCGCSLSEFHQYD